MARKNNNQQKKKKSQSNFNAFVLHAAHRLLINRRVRKYKNSLTYFLQHLHKVWKLWDCISWNVHEGGWRQG